MDQNAELISKVLVLDGDENAYRVLKVFCKENHLTGLRASIDSINDILKSNIDFGAVLISEEMISPGTDSLELSYLIHSERPDLPIFLRRKDSEDLSDLPEIYQEIFKGAYYLSYLETLRLLIHEQLFETYYPAVLVDGIGEVIEQCVQRYFIKVDIRTEPSFLVHDKVMEDFNSLIAIESKWCRGYLMIQVAKEKLFSYIFGNKTIIKQSHFTEQDGNAFISEITNEIWGSIKREFIDYGNEFDATTSRTQVPILINPDNRYITFGSSKPQLCYRFIIYDNDHELSSLTLNCKLIFSLDWSPEQYETNKQKVDDFIETGGLELF